MVTTGFTDGVEAQTQSLGFDGAVLYVPHPIQNRTAEELRRIADDIIDPAIRMLTT